MSDATPTVSIAIRAYRRRWLGEAIASVLDQTHRDLELVVYDDAGDLRELVGKFDDPRVRYHRPHARRATTAGRFQAALSLCRGRHLGVLDDDDRYEPQFVERLLRALEEDPAAGVAFCRVTYEVDGRRFEPPDPRPPGHWPNALREILAYRAVVWPSAMLIRREAYEAAERHRPIVEGIAPDAFLNVHAAVAGWGHFHVDAPLTLRRWHEEQGSQAGLATISEAVETWRGLSVGDGELEELRRRVLARKLLMRAIHRLEAGERRLAMADLAEARAADHSAWRLPRLAIGAAARVPGFGPASATAVLGTIRAHQRRSGPPDPARLPAWRDGRAHRDGHPPGTSMRAEEALNRGERVGIPDAFASPPADLPGWPGGERRWPAISEHTFLVLRPLSRGVAAAVARDLAPAGRALSVLDIGCGAKPYLPYFAAVATEYVGLDLEPGPQVDVVSQAERLPFEDACFDAVLSTQTLEHVADPPRVVQEIDRVLKPGGVLILTTHGTAVYHPCPTDLWRWTQEGLTKLLRDNGKWSSLRMEGTGGTAACFGYLIGFYVVAALQGRALAPLRKGLVTIVNVLFGMLDRIVPLRYPRRHTLIANFVVVARKAG